MPSPGPPLPSATAAESVASIHAILANNNKVPHMNGQPPPWNHHHASIPHQGHSGVGQPALQSSLGKRKADSSDGSDDTHAKIRRVVKEHVSQDPARVMPMTTVVCLHAAVAQKSYGSEKRFLCPPPLVHIEGPVWHMRSQQLSMAVVSEQGERSFEQKAPLDNNMTASFKFLHVTGTAKAKSFQLSLDISEPAHGLEAEQSTPGRIWATFESAPVTIISKPSKKTAKTRNISSCILAGGPVSLFNRINSQTVRTKYMTIDHAQLCASNVTWSAFTVNVVRRQTEDNSYANPQPVTYGAEIVLTDTNSGISTSPLFIRKVDKGKIVPEDGGPVSQMQKIALQRINPDGTRHYLSAAGPMPGTPGVVAPPAPGMSQQAGSHPLLFQSPRIRDEVKDGIRQVTDEVDDYLCWTIVGISKFQYTFFDAFGRTGGIPELPITPFPTLFTAPLYRPPNNSLELTVTHFFYEDPKTRQSNSLEVYLGSLGPLNQRAYQASPAVDHHGRAIAPGPPRYSPGGPLHSIVIVEMPPIADIIKALQEDTIPQSDDSNESSPDKSTPAPDGSRPPPASLAGRTLPILFIRACDGVGYHSGRTIALENVFSSMDLAGMGGNPGGPADAGWLAAAQAAVAEGGLQGWTLRVL
ncbi:hypothetical protein PUNSTDRAFT_110253 [Punctularia strigosozonata HHB-11173 SS5]|uniref:uncharacterized protein n=1 Tax=Punctularia strigosozonata (strain HHB-11173) TaxID=741275 RepID=UPI0004416C5C|nr:uncharacterized protein PUNSTDRAFT_110253 [Punctularia strigosozonata HHB-11173 SS5]EIN14119.1 hypothetical protein PUNSTDRAFT_110253 [Punctularia strigosozonata HHB-11173 SS5]